VILVRHGSGVWRVADLSGVSMAKSIGLLLAAVALAGCAQVTDLVLGPGGTVRFEDMRPVEGAYVVAAWEGYNYPFGPRRCYFVEVAQTDRNGNYSLKGGRKPESYRHLGVEQVAFLPGHAISEKVSLGGRTQFVGPPENGKQYFETLSGMVGTLACDSTGSNQAIGLRLLKKLIAEMELYAASPEDRRRIDMARGMLKYWSDEAGEGAR